MNQNSDQLSDLLRRWRVPDEVPILFRSSVWTQIASRQKARENTFWIRTTIRAGEFLARPAYASVTAAIALALGVGAAHVQAQSLARDRLQAAQINYLHLINPLARVGSEGQMFVD